MHLYLHWEENMHVPNNEVNRKYSLFAIKAFSNSVGSKNGCFVGSRLWLTLGRWGFQRLFELHKEGLRTHKGETCQPGASFNTADTLQLTLKVEPIMVKFKLNINNGKISYQVLFACQHYRTNCGLYSWCGRRQQHTSFFKSGFLSSMGGKGHLNSVCCVVGVKTARCGNQHPKQICDSNQTH